MELLIDEKSFKLGMRRLAAGVSIVTTAEAGMYHGLVATAVNSVSSDPPSLLVCVNRRVSSHDVFVRSKCLCVNLLSHDDASLVRRFSSDADRAIRFADRDWRELITGAPALVGSLASFDCHVSCAVEAYTHTIFIAEVQGLELWTDAVEPLVYLNGRLECFAVA